MYSIHLFKGVCVCVCVCNKFTILSNSFQSYLDQFILSSPGILGDFLNCI